MQFDTIGLNQRSHRFRQRSHTFTRAVCAAALALLIGEGTLVMAAQTSAARSLKPEQEAAGALVPGRFIDRTAASGMHFEAVASHTSKKYLIETMGSGVGVFDFDNDGLLDIFLVNGAPLADPTP